jgi:hypothetical protein
MDSLPAPLLNFRRSELASPRDSLAALVQECEHRNIERNCQAARHRYV